jgi:centromeric protein E
VFAPHDNNYKVYDASAKRLVRRVMEGYHGTVFAYGMTGTGKTFSMQGTTASPGVIPLAITDIFSYIRETPHREFLLRVSYLEIYNEKIYDLLSPHTGGGPGGGQEEIKLREDSKRGVYATPLKEEIVQSPTQLLRVIGRGDHARKTGTTQFNAHSSRSHAVVQIVVESRERLIMDASGMEDKRAPLAPGGVRVSTLSLIDLAGSERAADDKSRRTEGAHINKSLLTLGTVIARLSGDKDKAGNPTDKDGRHLPYRDSKLTRLLQGALSGGSLVSILCTIMIGGGGGNGAASSNHTGETLNTLKFASRAKNNIVSHAKKAEEALGGATDASRGLLERYRMEIQTLRSQLETQAKAEMEKEELQMEKEAEVRHEEQMLEMQLARTALKERIEHLNRLILSSQSIGVNGTFSSLSMHPQLTAYHTQSIGARSLRSSASHSSLVRTVSGASTTTLGTKLVGSRTPASIFPSGPTGEEDDSLGAYGDGTATLEAQNRALQSDLADKNRYINTLEKRLVQARRSSTNRASAGFPSVASLHEKDVEIASLRTQVAERDRKLANLEALAAKRSGLDTPSITPVSPSRHEPHSSHGSSDLEHSHNTSLSPVELLSPTKVSFDMGTADRGRRDSEGGRDRSANRKSVDEMSRILDEMIQDRVERGEVVRVAGKVGMRATRERRQESLAVVPSVGALVKGLRPDSQQVGLGLGI